MSYSQSITRAPHQMAVADHLIFLRLGHRQPFGRAHLMNGALYRVSQTADKKDATLVYALEPRSWI